MKWLILDWPNHYDISKILEEIFEIPNIKKYFICIHSCFKRNIFILHIKTRKNFLVRKIVYIIRLSVLDELLSTRFCQSLWISINFDRRLLKFVKIKEIITLKLFHHQSKKPLLQWLLNLYSRFLIGYSDALTAFPHLSFSSFPFFSALPFSSLLSSSNSSHHYRLLCSREVIRSEKEILTNWFSTRISLNRLENCLEGG